MATTGLEGSLENGADRTVAVMILRGFRVLTLECIGSERRVCCEHCACALKPPSQTKKGAVWGGNQSDTRIAQLNRIAFGIILFIVSRKIFIYKVWGLCPRG
jgi:hypothetical protein